MNEFDKYITLELPIKKELQQIFIKAQPSVIFDIGACEGEDSIRYSNLFQAAKVYSFEPLPDNYNKCLRNFSKASNRIKVFQMALSSSNGSATFYVSSGNPDGVNQSEWDYGNKSSSLYPPDSSYNKLEWLKFEKEIEVETQTISFFCENQSITQIDFIHMDVQGAEIDVLKGAGNMLTSIKAIWLEVENVSMYKGQPLKRDVELFMKRANFIKVIDTAFGESGDQLYVNAQFYSIFNLFIIKSKIISKLKLIYFKLISIKKNR